MSVDRHEERNLLFGLANIHFHFIVGSDRQRVLLYCSGWLALIVGVYSLKGALYLGPQGLTSSTER